MEWVAAEGVIKKVYKPGQPGNWTGILWHGNGTSLPTGVSVCGWKGELCKTTEQGDSNLLLILLILTSIVLFGLVLGSVFAIKRVRFESALKEIEAVTLDWNELKILEKVQDGNASQVELMTYKDDYIAVYKLASSTIINLQERRVRIDLKEMRELSNENVNPFIGICNENSEMYYFMAYAQRGSLQDVLLREETNLDWHFKTSILDDIASGMSYLHLSPVKYHGGLTSSRCVVDGRWTCKINGHGLRYIKKQAGHSMKYNMEDEPFKLLWTAPEILQHRSTTDENIFIKGDVFSFAIIAQEVILQDRPYGQDADFMTDKTILEKVMAGSNPPFRPSLPEESCKKGWKDLIESCWQEDTYKRLKFSQILSTIDKMYTVKNVSLVDNMIHRLESYTKKLEDRVQVRARELLEERRKVEAILSELLPKSVAEQLASGNKCDPECYENVSIFFSDIVGFTRISSDSTPIEIVLMLNAMYTMFDDIAYNFDVYKVATIGDAYMVASGVPIRNEDKHAGEICGMAVILLNAIQNFHIPHMENERLRMRIGVHTGPCVGAVIGIKMPRYLLFGDTVDIAARMESGGEAMRIHISQTTKQLVETNATFILEKRGDIDMKASIITTFWLQSKINI